MRSLSGLFGVLKGIVKLYQSVQEQFELVFLLECHLSRVFIRRVIQVLTVL